MPSRRSVVTGWVALVVVLCAHVAGVFAFASPRQLRQGAVAFEDAHALTRLRLHRAEAVRAGEGAYDPRLGAGEVVTGEPDTSAGVVGSTASALAARGWGAGAAYGTALLGLHLAVPLLALMAALVAGLGSGAIAVAVGLSSLLWWFDSVTHAAWYSGRLGWAHAALLVPVVAASGRLRAERLRPWALALGTVLVGALAPMMGVALGLSIAGALLTEPGGRRHAPPIAAMLVGLVSVWRLGASSGEPVGTVFASTLPMLAYDALDALSDGYGMDGNVRTAFRWLVVVAGAAGCWRWGRADRSARVIALFAGACATLAYLGGYAGVAWPVDPYWLWVPAAGALALPAAWLLATAAPEIPRLAQGPKLLVVIAAVVAVPQLGRAVFTYLPEAMPARFVRSPADLRVSALTAANERTPSRLGHGAPPALFEPIARRLGELRPAGRVAVLDRALSVYLGERTDAAVIGPLSLRGDAVTAADPGSWNPVDIGPSLERYAVEWVVTLGPVHPFERDQVHLEAIQVLETSRFYRVRAPTGYLLEGRGRVASQRLGEIRIEEAEGPRVVLRFRYSPLLRCEPGCTVEPAAVGPETFIAVTRPPPSFRIVARP